MRNIKMLTKAGYEGHARCMAHSLATASVAIAIVVIDLATQVSRQYFDLLAPMPFEC